MLNIYQHILNIDDLKNKFLARFLFSFLVILKVASLLCPIGDTDFYPLYKWSLDALENPEAVGDYTLADLPITDGNLLYLFSILFVAWILIIGAMVYCGVYMREYRLQFAGKIPMVQGKAISVGQLVFRIFHLSIIMVVLFIPILIFVLYLPLIFIIIFPCLILYVASYLSGDYSLIDSFASAIKRIRGFYIIMARDLSSFMLGYFLLDYILQILASGIPVVGYVVQPFLLVYMFLFMGRYAGFVHCRFIEIKKVPTALKK